MKITEKKTVTQDAIVDIRCNLCGESCLDTGECRNDLGTEVEITGCYGSVFPSDSTTWKFDLCELCVAFLVSKFKTYPDAFSGPFGSEDASKAMLVEGKTEGLPDWVITRYVAAMSRAALFATSEAESRAPLAAHAASRALEIQQEKHLKETCAMHEALDRIGAPGGDGEGYPVDRVLALAGSTDDRLVELLRKLHAFSQDRFDRKPVDVRAEALTLDDVAAYLRAHGKISE